MSEKVFIPLMLMEGLCPKCTDELLEKGYCTGCELFWHTGVFEDEDGTAYEAFEAVAITR